MHDEKGALGEGLLLHWFPLRPSHPPVTRLALSFESKVLEMMYPPEFIVNSVG